ncbi:hypothetical protein [Tahibacter caeni]|uniref:hypothetical protein n=1 Tax=Tahibacter caeni TaxID=1453545 RepID=UPI002148902D|nr:hypothetical protein [Tahibacter caeni]
MGEALLLLSFCFSIPHGWAERSVEGRNALWNNFLPMTGVVERLKLFLGAISLVGKPVHLELRWLSFSIDENLIHTAINGGSSRGNSMPTTEAVTAQELLGLSNPIVLFLLCVAYGALIAILARILTNRIIGWIISLVAVLVVCLSLSFLVKFGDWWWVYFLLAPMAGATAISKIP